MQASCIVAPKRVYLDTKDLILLCRGLQHKDVTAEEFLSRLQRGEAILVYSRRHIIELTRHVCVSEQDSKARLLEQLPHRQHRIPPARIVP